MSFAGGGTEGAPARARVGYPPPPPPRTPRARRALPRRRRRATTRRRARTRSRRSRRGPGGSRLRFFVPSCLLPPRTLVTRRAPAAGAPHSTHASAKRAAKRAENGLKRNVSSADNASSAAASKSGHDSWSGNGARSPLRADTSARVSLASAAATASSPSPRLSRRGPNLAGPEFPRARPGVPKRDAEAPRVEPPPQRASPKRSMALTCVASSRSAFSASSAAARWSPSFKAAAARFAWYPARLGSNLAASVKSACASQGRAAYASIPRSFAASARASSYSRPSTRAHAARRRSSTAMASSAAVALRISRSSAWTAGRSRTPRVLARHTRSFSFSARHDVGRVVGVRARTHKDGRWYYGAGRTRAWRHRRCGRRLGPDDGGRAPAVCPRRRQGRDGSRGRAGEETAQNARSWRQINVGEAFCRKRKLTTVSLVADALRASGFTLQERRREREAVAEREVRDDVLLRAVSLELALSCLRTEEQRGGVADGENLARPSLRCRCS